MRPTRIVIDEQAICHNLDRVANLAPKSQALVMLKANAYGHGILRVAQALPTDTAFAVACLEEALILREAGFTNRIVLLSGVYSPAELLVALENDCDMVVHHYTQISWIERSPLAGKLKVWLKLDTGMTRLGFEVGECDKVLARLNACSWVDDDIILMSHFAEAEIKDSPQTLLQLEIFLEATKSYSLARSLANSAAIINLPESHLDWVRPGIMIYGASPIEERTAASLELYPAMHVESQITQLKDVAPGTHIGYGGVYTCMTPTRVGLIPIGYGDGYPRHIDETAVVLCGEKLLPIIGRVSMDMLTVDCTGSPEVELGSPVILWGKGLPVETLAKSAGTISYELLCQIQQRGLVREANTY